MFEFTVDDVFVSPTVSIITGKANTPLFNGKIVCNDIELEVRAVFDNRTEIKDNLSFQVLKGKADKTLIGKIFRNAT